MHRMVVVVFDHETKAYEGKKVLMYLGDEGNIDVCADAVVTKNADGTMAVQDADNYDGPVGTLLGTAIGSLIGLLGGPIGSAIGLAVGGLSGAAIDLNKAHLDWEFIEEVNKILMPNKFALVAEIEENSTAPVDTHMEAIGGQVFRCSVRDVRNTLQEKRIAAMRADLARMKAKQTQTSADRKAKLQEKINKLDSKIQEQLQKAKNKGEAGTREEQAKAQVLKEKAVAAKAKAPAAKAS